MANGSTTTFSNSANYGNVLGTSNAEGLMIGAYPRNWTDTDGFVVTKYNSFNGTIGEVKVFNYSINSITDLQQTLVTNVISDYNLNNKYDINNNIKADHKFPYTCKISWEHNGGIPKFDTPPSNIGTLGGNDSPNNPSISYIGYDSLDGKYVAGFEDTIATDLKMVKIDSSGNTISGTGKYINSTNISNQTDLISTYNSATAITDSDGYIFNKTTNAEVLVGNIWKKPNTFTNYVNEKPIVKLYIDGEEKASMMPNNINGDWYLFGHINSLTSNPYPSGPALYINASEKEYTKQLISDGHTTKDMITEAFDFSVPIAEENTMRGILETNAKVICENYKNAPNIPMIYRINTIDDNTTYFQVQERINNGQNWLIPNDECKSTCG